jgi:probable F420-dependent oxidoreductase
VALSAAAAVTSRLTVATGVCLVAQRDPIVTAKAVATLDLLSHGRVVFGVGFGWNREEIEDHGIDFRRRRERGREHVLAMQQLWANERASFAGEFVRFEESWSWPKPVQQPRPPVLIGGFGGPKLFAHIAEYADGWYAMGLASLERMLPDLHRAMEAAGRDPARLRIVVPCDPTALPGTLEDHELRGASEVLIGLPTAPADAVLRLLDRHAKLL